MTYNEAISRYNVISNIILKDGDIELDRALKVKIIKNRTNLSKAKREWDLMVEDSVNQLKNAYGITDETPVETLLAVENKMNNDLQAVMNEQAASNIDIENDAFTEDEYIQIVNVNACHDAVINDQKIDSASLMELFHELFC